MKNKKAFSFVEIIITVSIIALLAVIGVSYQGDSNQKAENTRTIGDLGTLNNSLTSYLEDNKILPEPKGNKNYYNSGAEYEHDITNAFGVHGFATQNLLPKKYLDYLPLDPRTNQYYAYGKTIDNKYYEIAGVINENGKYKTKLNGNYTAENGPFSLIREYNGPNFIKNNSTDSFPYNPEEKILVARINTASGAVKITSPNYIISGAQILEHTLVQGDKINVPAGGSATIFFSDGSQSVLGDSLKESKLTLNDMQFKEDDNLLTRIKLSLESGTLWTKATRLNQDSDKSDFEVDTQDTTAAVRGTIFGVNANGTSTIVQVEKGEVEVEDKQNQSGSTPTNIEEGQNYKSNNKEVESSRIIDIVPFKTTTKFLHNSVSNNIITTGKTALEKAKSDQAKEISEAEIKVTENEYGKLYAHAEYNTAGDIKLLGKNGNNSTFTTTSGAIIGNIHNFKSDCDDSYNESKSFCKKDGKKGVFIDNKGNDDFLKYTGLNLGNNFTIEMSVYPTTNGGYIFYTSDNNNHNKFNYYSSSWQSNNNNKVDNLTLNSYNTIVFQCNSGTPSITINGSEQTINTNTSCYGFNNIYIGSKNNTGGQFNGIINYVRIYKK